MKGLLVKDLFLLKNQLNFFLIVSAIGLVLMFTQGDSMFVISYSSFIFSMFTLSTISYDEFDNGTAFLFTLPIDRNIYVFEKYVFGVLVSAVTWLITGVIAAAYTMVKHPGTNMAEWILTTFIFMLLPMLFLSLTLPVQLKFGAEKGRVAMFGVVGVAAVIIFVIGYILKAMGINVGNILDNLSGVGLTGFLSFAAVACIALYAISYVISLKIMQKKQF